MLGCRGEHPFISLAKQRDGVRAAPRIISHLEALKVLGENQVV